jgi:hypothetical protein
VILIAAVLYPDISDAAIPWTLGRGGVLSLIVAGIALLLRKNGESEYAADSQDEANIERRHGVSLRCRGSRRRG